MNKSPEPYQQPYQQVYPISPNPISPISPAVTKSGRETPDYFGREARYKSPSRSFSSPKPPPGGSMRTQTASWDSTSTHAQPAQPYYAGMDPLAMNKI